MVSHGGLPCAIDTYRLSFTGERLGGFSTHPRHKCDSSIHRAHGVEWAGVETPCRKRIWIPAGNRVSLRYCDEALNKVSMPRMKQARLRWWGLGFVLTVVIAAVMSVYGQAQRPPDYAVRSIRTEFSQGGAQIAVVFDVVNDGGASTTQATARVLDATGTQIGDSAIVAPLPEFGSQTVRIEFPTYLFANQAGRTVSLTASVGIGEVEDAGSDFVENNTARISVQIPDLAAQPPEGEDTAPAIDADAQAVGEGGIAGFVQSVLNGGTTELFGTPVDSRVIVIGIVIALFVALILIWVATMIVRLIFSQTPIFPNWQPPYTTSNYLDPNSLAGRRALWQPHAQSDTLPVPCYAGTFSARKVLTNMNGEKLGGWQVVGIRLNQYDMYGRVSRSQVIAAPRTVKRLNNLAKRSARLTAKAAERQTRGIAKELAREFSKKLNKRAAMLPIALDVRLDGRHGGVRITFELQQCAGEAYQPVDAWQPEMVVTTQGGIIHENFTYILSGQQQTEKRGIFLKRLRMDIARTLAEFAAGKVIAPPPAPKKASAPTPPPTPPSTPPVPLDIPGEDEDSDQTVMPGSTRSPMEPQE